ncbi:MAG TPA: sigma-70 family RNA polymerase sigma factor [Anaerolineales bacterium]|nr:sigma-70 family RNA polymerase sigma factor [Anaerolineales bacterium]
MNKDALAKIFDLYAPALYNYALRFCNDTLTADQIVGDVFAKLLDHLSAGHGPGKNLRSYLFEATYHLLVDDARYSHRRAPLEVIDFSRNDGYSADLRLENQILFETVLRIIQHDLTDYQRHVIILRFLEGFSLPETAAILGKSLNVVKAAQHHAIMSLRKAVDLQVAI